MSCLWSTCKLFSSSRGILGKDDRTPHLLPFLHLSLPLMHLKFSSITLATFAKRYVRGVQCSSIARIPLMDHQWSRPSSFYNTYTSYSYAWHMSYFSLALNWLRGTHKPSITRQETAIWIFCGSFELHTSARFPPLHTFSLWIQMNQNLRNFLLSLPLSSNQVSMQEFYQTHSGFYLCLVLILDHPLVIE